MLIPDDTEEGFKLSKQTVKKFLTVYEHTPGFSESVDNENTEKGNFIKLLNDGQEIPVSFIEGQTEDGILAMGMGKMFRFPYKHNIQELVEMEQKESEYKDKKNGTIKRDLCETIFGWIGNDSAKGRVQFGNAWADDIDKSQLEEEQSGVLGQPRASYYPLYIKQDKKRRGITHTKATTAVSVDAKDTAYIKTISLKSLLKGVQMLQHTFVQYRPTMISRCGLTFITSVKQKLAHCYPQLLSMERIMFGTTSVPLSPSDMVR